LRWASHWLCIRVGDAMPGIPALAEKAFPEPVSLKVQGLIRGRGREPG